MAGTLGIAGRKQMTYETSMETVMNQHSEQMADERHQRWRSEADRDRVLRAMRRAHRAERRLAAARRQSAAAHDAMVHAAVMAQLANVGN